MFILILYCISLIHHSGTANDLVCPQFQNVSISSNLEGKYNLLHVIISKNIRHLIDTAGPNFYQFMNSSIFTTKYKVTKCEGEERLWGYEMFWSLSRIRGRKSFSLVLDNDIPPRHPYTAGRDFSGEPGIQAPKKSLKLTGNPCWNSQFLDFK